MTIDQRRTNSEFISHSWNAGSSLDLDYTLTFDVKRDTLIVTGSAEQSAEGYRVACNAFGQAVVALLAQFENCALRLAIHGRSVDTNAACYPEWDMHILEEARHLGAVQRYYYSRWRAPPIKCQELENWVDGILRRSTSPGSPLAALALIERAARSFALMLHTHACDPLLVRLCSFILADEQFHGDALSGLANNTAPLDSVAQLIELAVADTNCQKAHFDLMRLLAVFSSEWLDPSNLGQDIRLDEINWKEANERIRKLERHASQNAHDYLSRLRSGVDAAPPPGLAIEWLFAGLRGRGQEPISRRRWVDLEEGK